ncbi:hypothetical protein COLO4_06213 [Corchorus olitorius]|uniref:Uncharacterized protein n=1 Tax=Corchorus olitorius TaxID=93759 RepID=A0A1R3KNM0_9ROSI|nr:hypothetical protein COLO4_06213 [Corchorus olitorius]
MAQIINEIIKEEVPLKGLKENQKGAKEKRTMWAASLTPVGPYLPPPKPKPKPTKHEPLNRFPTNVTVTVKPRLTVEAAAAASNESNDEGKEISGSAVLWALQRAAAKKKNSKRKKKGLASSSSSSGASRPEKESIDYSNVRPLEIKSEWSLKLDELEHRLQELENTT